MEKRLSLIIAVTGIAITVLITAIGIDLKKGKLKEYQFYDQVYDTTIKGYGINEEHAMRNAYQFSPEDSYLTLEEK